MAMALGAHPWAAQSAKPDETVTIVGCLVQGDPVAPSGAAGADDYFVRTPAIQVPVGTTVTVGGSGTAATTSAGDPDHMALYRVKGLDRDELGPHVSHRVELRGRLTNATAANTTTKTTVDADGRPRTRVETGMPVAGELQATAIKMISASCK
jgi:hypothetical protein